jgi:hypothetical protein
MDGNAESEPCDVPDLWVCPDEDGTYEFEIDLECAPGHMAGVLVYPGKSVAYTPMCTTDLQRIDIAFNPGGGTCGNWGK